MTLSESRFDNSLGFWSGWQRYAVALGALIFLFALLFWAFAELNRHNKDIQTGGNSSPFWRIGEVEDFSCSQNLWRATQVLRQSS